MPVTRLNHAVLYVRDVAVTREFCYGADTRGGVGVSIPASTPAPIPAPA